MSDILSNLTVRTKIDPSTPRDVLVSYVTDSIAHMLHSCAQQGLDPFGGKKPRGGWEGIELDSRHELDYYLSYVILLVNKLDRSELIDMVSRCHELALANPLDPDNATSLLHASFAANYLTATYCAENGIAFGMPEPCAGSFYEPSLSTDANAYRYRMACCGTVQALKTLMQLLEDENLGLGTMLGNFKILETTLNDTIHCLSFFGCAPTDLCSAMQEEGMLTTLSDRLKLHIEYRAESVDHQWEVHGLAQVGEVLELTKIPRFYYEFNESATYDDYVKYHTNKKMAKHVWKPRKKTEKQFQAACNSHEVEVLGQFELPLQYGDIKTLSYDILSSVVGDLTLRDVYVFVATCVAGFMLTNLDDDGRYNGSVPMSQDWDVDWRTAIAQDRFAQTAYEHVLQDGLIDTRLFNILVNRAYGTFMAHASFEPSLALALTRVFAGTIETAPVQKKAVATKPEPAPEPAPEPEPAPQPEPAPEPEPQPEPASASTVVFKPIRAVSPSVNAKAPATKKAAATTTPTAAAPKPAPKAEEPKPAPKKQSETPHNVQLIARLAPPRGSEIDKALSKASEPIRVLYATIMNFVDALPYQVLYITRTNHTSCTVVKTNGQEVIFGSVRKPTKTYIAVNLKPGSRGFGYGEGGAELEPRESSPDGLFRNVKGVGFWGNGHLEIRLTPDLLENGELPKIVQDAILDAAEAAHKS